MRDCRLFRREVLKLPALPLMPGDTSWLQHFLCVMQCAAVLFRLFLSVTGADALERATKVKIIVFDKTGTLTKGRPTVTDHRVFLEGELPFPSSTQMPNTQAQHHRHCDRAGLVLFQNADFPHEEFLHMAAAAEASSEHPLAKAVLSYARSCVATGTSTLDLDHDTMLHEDPSTPSMPRSCAQPR